MRVSELKKIAVAAKAQAVAALNWDASAAAPVAAAATAIGAALGLDEIQVWKDVDMSVQFDLFNSMYHYSTLNKHQFFYIDVRNERFRENFNKELIVDTDIKLKLTKELSLK